MLNTGMGSQLSQQSTSPQRSETVPNPPDQITSAVRKGFIVILCLTFLLGIVGLYQLHNVNQSMNNIVNIHNKKVSLAFAMRDAIRLRAWTIQKMQSIDDVFLLDEELQRFYSYAGIFRKAREQLMSLVINENERTLHEELLELARSAQPINRAAAEKIAEGTDPSETKRLVTLAIEQQTKVLDALDRSIDLQKFYAQQAVSSARDDFLNTVFTMAFLIVILLLIGFIVARKVTFYVFQKNKEISIKNVELANASHDSQNLMKEKSDFLAAMSHEIRTPLTSIIGFSDTLLDRDQSPEDIKHAAQSIYSSSLYLHHLINDVLDISKIEAGRVELENKIVDVSEIVATVLSMFKEKAEKKGVHLYSHFNVPYPRNIKTDPVRLKQILINLIGNAIKFTERGSICVSISYHTELNQLQFDVTDTGIGMNEMEMARIFKPFSQANAGTARKYGGTGLGLSISKQLAELLGGSMFCDSIVNEGSTFTLIISVDNSQANDLVYEHTSVVSETKPSSESLSPSYEYKHYDARVLLAEDTPEIQRLITMYLRKVNIIPVIVSSGREAVEEATKHSYDLILMDTQMPEMGGLEATKIIRQLGRKSTIISLTGNVSKEDIESCLSAGADSHLSKPIDVGNFYRVIQKYLHDHEIHDIKPETKQALLSDIDTIPDYDAEFDEILRQFIHSLPDLLDEITSCADSKDWDGLHATTHKLKGMGGSFGYANLTNISKHILDCVRQHKEEGLGDYIKELRANYDTIKADYMDKRKTG